MSDRHSAYIVVLDNDVRDDDSEAWQNALRMLRGVISVTPVMAEPIAYIEQQRAKQELRAKLMKLICSLD